MKVKEAIEKIGPWECIVVEPEGPAADLTVCFLHGYGADMQDLAPLAHEIAAPSGKTVRWVFPQGPLSVPLSPHWEGRAWAKIDMNAIQEAMMKGEHRDLSGPAPAEFDHTLKDGLRFLEALGDPLSRVVLGGFSQGSMMATAMALTAPQAPAGLVILSGNLVDAAHLREWAPRRRGMHFYQAHGEMDPVLGLAGASRLHALLSEAGLVGTFHGFRGAHEIPRPVLSEVASFLQEVAP